MVGIANTYRLTIAFCHYLSYNNVEQTFYHSAPETSNIHFPTRSKTVALQYVSVIPVYVNDQEKAVDFYVNKLGFTKTIDEPYGEGRWIQVQPPEGQATLTISRAADYGVTPGKFTGFVFYSDDVKGTVADLKAKGVNVTEDANEQPWGVQAQFEDPDGNGYVIVGK